LPEGLPETANEDNEECHHHVWHKKRKHSLVDQIVDIALSGTQIPLSIFTNLFHKGFRKHSMLESTLEILQQFYIQQAERGFAKEASVYFPYLDSVLFCTVHFATLPFRHSAIPPFRHSAIPPFCHSTIPPFRHSAILPFCRSAIPLQ
jgi:hypothetical protein